MEKWENDRILHVRVFDDVEKIEGEVEGEGEERDKRK